MAGRRNEATMRNVERAALAFRRRQLLSDDGRSDEIEATASAAAAAAQMDAGILTVTVC